MVATRADKYTQIGKKSELFSDFLNNFDHHPVSNALGRITNENSIKQAIRNIVQTNIGERPFELEVGSNSRASLFELNDFVASDTLKSNIEYAIKTYEKRAQQVKVEVQSNDVYLYINITFAIINSSAPVELQIILRRVR